MSEPGKIAVVTAPATVKTSGTGKSVNDIWDQYDRIRSTGDRARTERAYSIASRYGENVQNSPAWRNAFASGERDFRRYNNDTYLNDYESRAKTAGYGRADNVKVPRSVYMRRRNNR